MIYFEFSSVTVARIFLFRLLFVRNCVLLYTNKHAKLYAQLSPIRMLEIHYFCLSLRHLVQIKHNEY